MRASCMFGEYIYSRLYCRSTECCTDFLLKFFNLHHLVEQVLCQLGPVFVAGHCSFPSSVVACGNCSVCSLIAEPAAAHSVMPTPALWTLEYERVEDCLCTDCIA